MRKCRQQRRLNTPPEGEFLPCPPEVRPQGDHMLMLLALSRETRPQCCLSNAVASPCDFSPCLAKEVKFWH
ncbi:hypothetical protein [Dendronalium sp. ChiSLP03b]|uniref:hypothetical protein n=1 Tax=Dendronalium sp. ChiSLP03b TaxID=3075381 RepID=UPI003919547D